MSKSQEIWEEKLTSEYAVKSQRIYRKTLNEFLAHESLDHEGLFNLHLEAQRSTDPRDRDAVARKVKSYRTQLVERGVSTSHADQIKKAVRAFMDANGMDFSIRNDKFKVFVDGQNRAKDEDIEAFIEATGEYRTLALIHTLKDSGLRVSEVVKFNVGDVLNGGEYVHLKVRQKKTKNLAFPIIGPQAVNAIKKWLNHRESKGYPYSDNDPLFTTLEGPGAFIDRMSSDSVTQVFIRLRRKTKLKKISAHSLRKYFVTRAQAGGIPDAWICILQGRVIPGSIKGYSKPEEQELMTAYKKAYPFIEVGMRHVSSKKVEGMEKKMEIMDSMMKEMIADSMMPKDQSDENVKAMVRTMNETLQEVQEAYGESQEINRHLNDTLKKALEIIGERDKRIEELEK